MAARVTLVVGQLRRASIVGLLLLGVGLSVLLGISEANQSQSRSDARVASAIESVRQELPRRLEQLELLLSVADPELARAQERLDLRALFPSARSIFVVPERAGGPALDRPRVVYPSASGTVPLLRTEEGRAAARSLLRETGETDRIRLSAAVAPPGENAGLLAAVKRDGYWIVVGVPADAFLDQAVAPSSGGIALSISEGRPSGDSTPIATFSPAGPLSPDALERGETAMVEIGGRVWTVRARPTDPPSWIDWSTIVTGLAITFFVVGLLVAAVMAERQAKRLAAAMTAGLARRTRELETLTSNSRDPILRFDSDRRLVFANPAALAVAGLTDVAWRAARITDLPVPAALASVLDEQIELACKTGMGRRADVAVERPGCPTVDLEADFIPEYTDGEEEPSGVLVIARDVTERKRVERDLARRALEDGLTGLANRTLVLDRIEQALARRTSRGVAVLVLDLDRFKLINDSLGHHIGDAVLIEVAERLRPVVRADDTVGRLGGDELVIVAEVSEHGHALHLANRVLAALRRPLRAAGHELVVTASVGLTQSAAEQPAEQLLRDADTAMYRAKAEGGNTLAVFDATMSAQALARLRLESAIREGLERDEFTLHFQPLVAAESEAATGFEALVRWQRGDQLIGPVEFIDVAEQTGLIVPLGDRVLRLALRQAAAWQLRERGMRVWVNVSVQQIRRPEFVEATLSAIAREESDPTVLGLEVTETVLARDTQLVQAPLAALRERGVAIALDDFGQGYSSLARLKELPIDSIKIDRAFVRGVPGSVHDMTIIDAVVRVARALGTRTVAEGVETPEQAAALRYAGCDVLQGFLFARPAPAESFASLLPTLTRTSG